MSTFGEKKSLFHPQFSPHLGQLKDLARDVYLVCIKYVQWSLLLFADLKSHCLLAVIVSPPVQFTNSTKSPPSLLLYFDLFFPVSIEYLFFRFRGRKQGEEGFCGKFLIYWSFCRTFQLPRQSGNHFGFAAAMRQICGKISHPNLRSNLATIGWLPDSVLYLYKKIYLKSI